MGKRETFGLKDSVQLKLYDKNGRLKTIGKPKEGIFVRSLNFFLSLLEDPDG